MNETPKNIIIKISAIISFLGLIVVGGGMSFFNANGSNWVLFWVGIAVLMLGFFITAILAQYIGKHDGDSNFEHLTFFKSIKGGLLFTFFVSFIIFLIFGIYFWTEYGFYEIGIVSILSFIFMVFLAIIISMRYQTGSIKKVLKDPNSVEREGIVKSIEPHSYIISSTKVKVFFYRCCIDVDNGIDSILSTTYLKSSNPLLKELLTNDIVKVKINPKKPNYCAIVEKLDE